ncbi:anchored repeat-type ABC transporter permease subunit [Pseudoclavibacter endophyticus]|nr:metal ABC transporter permease [Pseudoclavibacter endophyticus]GGA67647.1 anchored repeat-type ABC transporter permease subunit [Pseudoclavibacter endophyticus]
MDYFTTAMVCGVLIGVLCGLVGVLVVLRRRAFFTVALTHATFPGGVLAAILGVNVVLGAGVMGLALMALMVWLSRIHRQGSQVAAGVVLSLGYALGMLLLSLNPWLPVKVDSFLAGHILAIPVSNVVIIAVVLGVTVLAYVAYGKELLFSTFDRRGFVASGHRESSADVVALGLITLTVVAVMPAIGSILAIAMIAAPAASARLLTKRVGRMLVIACLLGAVAAVGGLVISRYLGFAAGGAIAIAATLVFLISLAIRTIRSRSVASSGGARGRVSAIPAPPVEVTAR